MKITSNIKQNRIIKIQVFSFILGLRNLLIERNSTLIMYFCPTLIEQRKESLKIVKPKNLIGEVENKKQKLSWECGL